MAYIYHNGKLVLVSCLVLNENKELLLLYRTKHKQWETPGGKVEEHECLDPNSPTQKELEQACIREVFEELGDGIVLSDFTYFGAVESPMPSGSLALIHKFMTRIVSGTPRVNEPKTFSDLQYISVDVLQDYPLVPDLYMILPKLKNDH